MHLPASRILSLSYVKNFCLTALGFGAGAADPLIGTKVYVKDNAVAKVGETTVDISKLVSFPATVKDVNGDWLWLGRAWVRKQDVMDLNTAFDYFVEEVRRNPRSAQAWGLRARCWDQKGETDNAIQDYNEAIRLDPKEKSYYNNRGIAKEHKGDHDAAIRDYDEAIQLDPKFSTAYLNRGEAKQNKGEYDAAIRDYDEAIRLDPEDATAYRNRGVAKRSKLEYAAAIRDYDEANRLDPKDATVYVSRGWSYHLLGEYAEAIIDYETASRLDPKDEYAVTNLSFLLSTCPDEKLRDPQKALQLAETALRLVPQDAYALNAKACAMALEGDFDAASKLTEQALENEEFRKDDSIEGGVRALERLAAWKKKKLWFAPAAK